jgi:hypothetical protein
MTALGDFSSGDVLTAADLNAIGDWQSYTPSIEGSTTDPTATTSGLYYELNEIVFARIRAFSFTAAGSGTYYLTTPTDIDGDLLTVAYGSVRDGTLTYPIVAGKSGSGARRLFMTLTYNNANITHTSFSLSGSDFIWLNATYKKA